MFGIASEEKKSVYALGWKKKNSIVTTFVVLLVCDRWHMLSHPVSHPGCKSASSCVWAGADSVCCPVTLWGNIMTKKGENLQIATKNLAVEAIRLWHHNSPHFMKNTAQEGWRQMCACAVSQGKVKHWEESAIYPYLHTQAYTWPCHPSHPKSSVGFALSPDLFFHLHFAGCYITLKGWKRSNIIYLD